MRLTFDNNYFNALYQGIPNEGYTALVANLLQGIEVRLDTDYLWPCRNSLERQIGGA